MTVHFIGAGPGAPDLITLRGRDLIARSPVVLYAGSLVPEAVIAHAGPEAEVTNTADMTLDEIVERMAKANERRLDVARVHSGDPSLYGATGEQMRRLAALGIDYDITPGVPAFAAAAAALGRELTLPEVSQTVILTRTAMRSTEMPNHEDLETLARAGATLAIHLSARNTRYVEQTLIPFYGADCPAAIVARASWPDQRLVRCRLDELHRTMRAEKIRRTALILVGRVLAGSDHRDSKLYDPTHFHLLRPKKRKGASKAGEFSEADCRLLESIIRARRDVRGNRFTAREVPDALIDRLLDAALHAPSVGYSQPWSFVVIRDAAVREAIAKSFERQNERAEQRFSGERGSLYRRLKLEGIREAPINIAVFYVPSEEPVLGQTTVEEVGPYSVVCAVQNMWLLGRALNLGIGWVSILDPAEVASILGAPPAHRLVAYLCVGYVEAFPDVPELETLGWAERKDKASLVHRDRYR